MSVSTTATDAVDAVYNILNDVDNTVGGYGSSYGWVYGGSDTWTHTDPQVLRQWEITQQEKEHLNDPTLIVWSPVEGTYNQFGAEYEDTVETETVEVQVWTLDADKTATYAGEVVTLFEEYANDNENRTQFQYLRPTAISDDRAEQIPRKTDHFITSVTIEIQRLKDTGYD